MARWTGWPRGPTVETRRTNQRPSAILATDLLSGTGAAAADAAAASSFGRCAGRSIGFAWRSDIGRHWPPMAARWPVTQFSRWPLSGQRDRSLTPAPLPPPARAKKKPTTQLNARPWRVAVTVPGDRPPRQPLSNWFPSSSPCPATGPSIQTEFFSFACWRWLASMEHGGRPTPSPPSTWPLLFAAAPNPRHIPAFPTGSSNSMDRTDAISWFSRRIPLFPPFHCMKHFISALS